MRSQDLLCLELRIMSHIQNRKEAGEHTWGILLIWDDKDSTQRYESENYGPKLFRRKGKRKKTIMRASRQTIKGYV